MLQASAYTIAGTAGTEGSVDGPPATARFSFPAAVAVDDEGCIYVAERSGNRIRRILADESAVQTYAGTGTAAAGNGFRIDATFSSPVSLAVDQRTGDVFVSDSYNRTIRVIRKRDGKVETLGGLEGQLGSQVGGIALDPRGNLVVADTFNQVIKLVRFTPDDYSLTHVSVLAGRVKGKGMVNGAALDEALFYNPVDVAVEPKTGRIAVVDKGNHCIRLLTPSAGGGAMVVSTLCGTGGVPPSPTAAVSGGFVDGASLAAKFNAPLAARWDRRGNLVVADTGNHRLRYVDLSRGAHVSTLAGCGVRGFQDGTGDVARFHSPRGLCFDASDNLLVTEDDAHRIRIVVAPTLLQPSSFVFVEDMKQLLPVAIAAATTAAADHWYSPHASGGHVTQAVRVGGVAFTPHLAVLCARCPQLLGLPARPPAAATAATTTTTTAASAMLVG